VYHNDADIDAHCDIYRNTHGNAHHDTHGFADEYADDYSDEYTNGSEYGYTDASRYDSANFHANPELRSPLRTRRQLLGGKLPHAERDE